MPVFPVPEGVVALRHGGSAASHWSTVVRLTPEHAAIVT